ncbi:MAG: S8 family serine peptidase [Myxococcales bacterium]|nr:S8 family serine peptidase [Myxococcales bacterium]MCB9520140.1 S8 family serine peptidase [Myxococcales bacterium]MCB9531239.1 S8 family serine peptidase [Myxococcales bacterium]MCB9534316.1 S8 family serine peptidase [Myxococcales bacterium]
MIGRPYAAGAGVLVAVVDHDLDVRHPALRGSDDRPRLEAIWDQRGGRPAPAQQVGDGVFSEYARRAGRDHATGVVDLAAGAARSMAPAAAIAFVDLDEDDDPCHVASGEAPVLCESRALVSALEWAFEQAGARPCVVNVSLAGRCGPRDGTSPVERAIDALVTAAPNRAVVLAAGNDAGRSMHAHVEIPPEREASLDWTVAAGPEAAVVADVWITAASPPRLSLAAQDNPPIPLAVEWSVAPATTAAQTLDATIEHSRPSHEHYHLRVRASVPASTAPRRWSVRFAPSATPLVVDGWLDPTEPRLASFGDQRSRAATLSALACGQHAIVVGATDPSLPSGGVAGFSGIGPTCVGAPKPDLAAPGAAVRHACAPYIDPSLQTVSRGTSFAAPQVASVVAAVFGLVHAAGMRLETDELHALLRASVVGGTGDWDPRLGWGHLDARATLRAARRWIAAQRRRGA